MAGSAASLDGHPKRTQHSRDISASSTIWEGISEMTECLRIPNIALLETSRATYRVLRSKDQSRIT